MEVFASRDLSFGPEELAQLREIVESTPFHCKVLVYPQYRVGLIRIEYDGNSEEEIKECDLKLTSKIITTFEAIEAKGSRHLVLFPLELALLRRCPYP